MENREGQPEQDKIVSEVSVRHSNLNSTLYHRHESGKVTQQSLSHHQNGEFFFENPVDITNRSRSAAIDWDRKFVDEIRPNQAQARKEPVKKGKAETAIHTIADLGRKIVQPIRKGGK